MPHTPEQFDWSDIDVGNNQLNHSQNYFAMKHDKHERKYEATVELHTDVQKIETEENVFIPAKAKDYSDVKQEPQLEAKDNIPQKANKILTTKKKCSKTAQGAISKALPPPQAYLVKDIYRRNREEAEIRRAEEENRKREFHARPAPKFSVHHETKNVHALTVPVTPQVLKKSLAAAEKNRKRLEEWKLNNQPPIFKSSLPTILKEKPFLPEKKTMILHQCPFKLNTEKRLHERKQYDAVKQKNMVEKQKQEEEERKKREEEQIKEIRKAATFKARPNPFKNKK